MNVGKRPLRKVLSAEIDAVACYHQTHRILC